MAAQRRIDDQYLGNSQSLRLILVERVRGIEPPYQAWEACVLPLNYTRDFKILMIRLIRIGSDEIR